MEKVIYVITKHDGFGRVEVLDFAFTTQAYVEKWCEDHSSPKGLAPYYEYAAVKVHEF